MEVTVFWNKDKCKWNVYYDNKQQICHKVEVEILPVFKIWPEGGQFRGAVFFYGEVEIIKDNEGIITALIK